MYHPEGSEKQESTTHKVILGPQPLCPVLLQKALQEVPRRVGNIWFQLEGLVQNVVIHLCCVPAVERRLEKKMGGRNYFTFSWQFVQHILPTEKELNYNILS